MKCQCCGKKIYCKCDTRGFKVGQYVRTTKEYGRTLTTRKAFRGKIIHLKDRSATDEAPLATVKTFFGSKHTIDVSWLREPFNGAEDAFYDGQIKELEEQVLELEAEALRQEAHPHVAEKLAGFMEVIGGIHTHPALEASKLGSLGDSHVIIDKEFYIELMRLYRDAIA